MIGHLGSRVSALLDGQLGPEETERAWAHVHTCHSCRDLVEREGWVKTRLAGLSFDDGHAPAGLKGSLLHAPSGYPDLPADLSRDLMPGEAFLVAGGTRRHRRAGLATLGGGAAGAAVLGVLVFGTGPADAPDQRPAPVPPASVSRPTPSLTAGTGSSTRAGTGPTARPTTGPSTSPAFGPFAHQAPGLGGPGAR